MLKKYFKCGGEIIKLVELVIIRLIKEYSLTLASPLKVHYLENENK